jgi:hypothetical protein
MDTHKTLPPLPLKQRAIQQYHDWSPLESFPTIHEENQQLRLQNQNLIKQIKNLKAILRTENLKGQELSHKIDEHYDKIQSRDELVSEIASTIVAEFQRYKDYVAVHSKETND